MDHINVSLAAGSSLSHYRIVSQLGAGGMGEVYLAEDVQLARRVAIKLLASDVAADEAANRRLVQEARAAASLDHPNICSIYEVGEVDGRNFIVMQYLEGQTLEATLKTKPLTSKESITIAAQITDALTEAHSHNIIHRDIKPANIMITSRGQAKMMDFGLARVVTKGIDSEAVTQSMGLTTPGTILGTLPYMSPEQVRGEALDVRSDIFSFGVVLYEMLSGRHPFANRSAAETISAILKEEPSMLSPHADDVPEELQRIARKCLEKDRNLRYQHAADIGIDLQRLQRDSVSLPAVANTKVEIKNDEDAPPAGNKAVYAFLELFALAFTFEGAAALLRGESVWKIVGAWIVAIFFFIAGIKWPRIRLWLGQHIGPKRSEMPADQRVRTSHILRPRNFIVPIVSIALAFMAAAYFYFPRRATGSSSQIKSLTVLPLKSLDSGDNYLGLGIADAVIRRINQTGELSVRPTSAVRRYLTEDVDAITAAQQLNTDAVLEGSVQRSSDRLRVTVNLLRTSNGEPMWSEQFNMNMTDIFTIQDTVAQQLVSRLRLRLDPVQQAQLTKRPTANPIAYEFYLKGVYNFDQRLSLTKPQLEGTVDFFKRAIEADPKFALAHAQLAYVYATMGVFIDPTEPSWAELAKVEINLAQVLDPQLAETHLARFQLLHSMYEGFQAEAAIRELLLAQQLDPNVGRAEMAYLYMHLGLEDLATRELATALELDPTSDFVKGLMLANYQLGGVYDGWFVAHQKLLPNVPIPGWYFLATGNLAAAQEAIEKASVPGSPNLDKDLDPQRALLFALKGEFRAAEDTIPVILNKHPVKDPFYHHAAYAIGCIYALEGKSAEAVKWLREAAATGFQPYPLLNRDAYLNRIRQKPEFIQFLEEMKAQNGKYRREFE